MIGVYEIKNTVTGEFYIGSSIDVFDRWRQHMHQLERGKHPTKRLQAAWAEYGRPFFAFLVIQETGEDERLDVEMALIRERKPAYNGQLEDRLADEMRKPKPKREHQSSQIRRTRIVKAGNGFEEVYEFYDKRTANRPIKEGELPPFCPYCFTVQQYVIAGSVYGAYTLDTYNHYPAPSGEWPERQRILSSQEASQCVVGDLAISVLCLECNKPVLLTYVQCRPYLLPGVCPDNGETTGDTPVHLDSSQPTV